MDGKSDIRDRVLRMQKSFSRGLCVTFKMLASQRYTPATKKKRQRLNEFGNYVAFPLLVFPMGLHFSFVHRPPSIFHNGFLLPHDPFNVCFRFYHLDVIQSPLPHTRSSLLVSHSLFALLPVRSNSLPHTQWLCHVSEVQACLIPRGSLSNFNPLFPAVLNWLQVKYKNRPNWIGVPWKACCVASSGD